MAKRRSSTTVAEKATLDTAKRIKMGEIKEITASTGVRIRVKAVATMLLSSVAQKISMPEIPVWHNENKGRDEPNPNDPRYLAAVQQTEELRGLATIDAMVMFGVELVDPLPEDDRWIRQLRMIGQDVPDKMDELTREFYYKRYIACGTAEIALLSSLTGASEKLVTEAVRNFQRS